jgi:hypothetical protein
VVRFINEGNPMYEGTTTNLPQNTDNPLHGTKITYNVRDHPRVENKMNCELMLTYDTPALRQTGSRNLTGQKTLPTIWGTYMKLMTKYQIPVINSC